MSDAPERILSLLRKYDEYNNIIDMYGYCYYVEKMKKVRSEIIELFSEAQKWREFGEWCLFLEEAKEFRMDNWDWEVVELDGIIRNARQQFRALEKELREKEAVCKE